MGKKILATSFFSLASLCAFAQQLSYSDAAQAYNRLLIEKNNGIYIRIGNYKVVGTPYLFGEKNKGDLFAKGETGYNILINYNTYNQEVEFYSSNLTKPLIKEPQQVDSFILKQNAGSVIEENLKFISGEVLGIDDDSFYQLMYAGPKFNLYKNINPPSVSFQLITFKQTCGNST